jgi:hypothetical protein
MWAVSLRLKFPRFCQSEKASLISEHALHIRLRHTDMNFLDSAMFHFESMVKIDFQAVYQLLFNMPDQWKAAQERHV